LANNPSALKRWRQSLRRRAFNKPIRTRARSTDRAARRLLAAGDSEAAATALRQAQSALDGAAQKGVLHKNTAARRKSRLMKQLAKLQAAPPPVVEAAPKRRASTRSSTRASSRKKAS
jgi:small subunit ribosomal protein S20